MTTKTTKQIPMATRSDGGNRDTEVGALAAEINALAARATADFSAADSLEQVATWLGHLALKVEAELQKRNDLDPVTKARILRYQRARASKAPGKL